ncbi:MAG: DNA-binding MarR family transcriptional regulator [Candidatus Pelagisphaera sp.]|jgi:DNA-binding MarR family transcriptional regulator
MNTTTLVDQGRTLRRQRKSVDAISFQSPFNWAPLNKRTGIHDVEFAFYNLQRSNSSETPSRVNQKSSSKKPDSWTFFSNHAHVLLCLHRDPDVLLREVAVEVGITERAVQKIVAELEDAQVVTRKRVGRRNHYMIKKRAKLRHPIESHRTVSDLLEFVK